MASSQKIVNIKLDDLQLWTENPRDPINTEASDSAIIKRAIADDDKKWNLPKMLSEMGPHYDFSELPTVVSVDGRYVVYDGNRRMAVLKYIQNKELYAEFGGGMFPELEPEELRNLDTIPCNLCDKETALTNIERKHINSGSWGQLERDYFAYHHRGKEKSLFMRLDEQSGGYIGRYKSMNKRFVKDEVLNSKNLREIGFLVNDRGEIESPYSRENNLDILDKIRELIEEKVISTRSNRSSLKEPLVDRYPDIDLKPNAISADLKPLEIDLSGVGGEEKEKRSRKTPRTRKKQSVFFLDNMPILRPGEVNNIYRDILSLYDYYVQKQEELSVTFPSLIRMSFRLFVESASEGVGTKSIQKYVNDNYQIAKSQLTKDQKTTLSNNGIKSSEDLIKLLQTGAHNYTNSSNLEQTIAMSIIIGSMIANTHRKDKNDKK